MTAVTPMKKCMAWDHGRCLYYIGQLQGAGCQRLGTAILLGLMLLLILVASALAVAAPEEPSDHCDGPLTQRLLEAAVKAPSAAGNDGTLYGMQRWHPPTSRSILGMKFPGLLSCAYTVSAILRKACHPIGEIAAVKEVDMALKNWAKVTRPEYLKPGDVVFWKPFFGRSTSPRSRTTCATAASASCTGSLPPTSSLSLCFCGIARSSRGANCEP